MATDIFFPASDAGDGSIFASSGSAWDTARNATTGTLRVGNFVQSTLSGSTRFIERTFLTFNTSSIPDNALISSATLEVYVVSVSNANAPSYRLYDSTHASTIVAGDYDNVGTTEQSATYLTAPTTSAYATFTLNASGRASINLTGDTKFAIREAVYDLGNVQPGGSNVLETSDSSVSGTSQDPKLTVTYTVGETFDISETISLIETSTNLRGINFSVSETTTLIETWTALKGVSFSIAETIGLVEAYNFVHNRVFTIAETISLIEFPFTLLKKWNNPPKNNVIMSNTPKNNSTWTNEPKN